MSASKKGEIGVAFASRHLGKLRVELGAGEAAPNFIIVETALERRVGEAVGDVRGDVGITIVPPAAEHQVQAAPIGQIPCAKDRRADRWMGHAPYNARIAIWIHRAREV